MSPVPSTVAIVFCRSPSSKQTVVSRFCSSPLEQRLATDRAIRTSANGDNQGKILPASHAGTTPSDETTSYASTSLTIETTTTFEYI